MNLQLVEACKAAREALRYPEHAKELKLIDQALESADLAVRRAAADGDRRFVIVHCDGGVGLMTATEAASAIDMQDFHEPFTLFYSEDGKLHPVTTAEPQRCNPDENSIIFSVSDMLANGKVVGHVHHTDH